MKKLLIIFVSFNFILIANGQTVFKANLIEIKQHGRIDRQLGPLLISNDSSLVLQSIFTDTIVVFTDTSNFLKFLKYVVKNDNKIHKRAYPHYATGSFELIVYAENKIILSNYFNGKLSSRKYFRMLVNYCNKNIIDKRLKNSIEDFYKIMKVIN